MNLTFKWYMKTAILIIIEMLTFKAPDIFPKWYMVSMGILAWLVLPIFILIVFTLSIFAWLIDETV